MVAYQFLLWFIIILFFGVGAGWFMVKHLWMQWPTQRWKVFADGSLWVVGGLCGYLVWEAVTSLTAL